MSKKAAGVRHLQIIVRISIMAALAILLATGCGSDEKASNTANTNAEGSNREHSRSHSHHRGLHSTGDVCFDRGQSFEGETRLYIEHNATDQDTGVHGMFD